MDMSAAAVRSREAAASRGGSPRLEFLLGDAGRGKQVVEIAHAFLRSACLAIRETADRRGPRKGSCRIRGLCSCARSSAAPARHTRPRKSPSTSAIKLQACGARRWTASRMMPITMRVISPANAKSSDLWREFKWILVMTDSAVRVRANMRMPLETC
jgi:hypothetical protein